MPCTALAACHRDHVAVTYHIWLRWLGCVRISSTARMSTASRLQTAVHTSRLLQHVDVVVSPRTGAAGSYGQRMLALTHPSLAVGLLGLCEILLDQIYLYKQIVIAAQLPQQASGTKPSLIQTYLWGFCPCSDTLLSSFACQSAGHALAESYARSVSRVTAGTLSPAVNDSNSPP